MLKFRKAGEEDAALYFDWANDEVVRKQSYHSGMISWEEHISWFNKKLGDPGCLMLLFENERHEPVGQVRFQQETDSIYVIGISIAKEFRGKGYASRVLEQAATCFLDLHPTKTIYAYIKKDNEGSIRSFSNAGFLFSKELLISDAPSVLYTKNNSHENS